ncbi:MAG: hypothetical protein ACFE91_02640 [Promethearchaeota archaeon]
MWKAFKSGNYEAIEDALAHWKNEKWVKECLVILRSSRYLDKWLGMM